jgi:hypothetical protein
MTFLGITVRFVCSATLPKGSWLITSSRDTKYPALQLEFDNLQVLCDDCNRGKGRDDETDFRPKTPEPEIQGLELEHLKSIQ